jgi:quinolinate synthase
LLPDLLAGCSLADSCPASQFESFRRQYPDHVAISYINCSAGVKALSDLICTSSNAEKMIRSVPENTKILFAPDKNLGKYLMKKTGRDMVLWQGACIVHDTFSERKIIRLMMEHPTAKLAAHPECEETMLDRADFVGSTTGILRYVQSTDFKEYIIATEPGIIHQMEKTCPGKLFIPAPPEANCACNECPYMKLNTLEKLHACMDNLYPEVELPEEIMDRAAYPIRRMLELS